LSEEGREKGEHLGRRERQVGKSSMRKERTML
jgi:hypothetical protein